MLGGLNPDGFSNLKMAVYAVIAIICSETTIDDMLAVRALRASPSNNGNALVLSTSTATPKVPSLLVTLSSATIARTILIAKIKLRKLHSTQIRTDLITAAGPREQLRPAFININEYSPRNLHKLKMLAVAKAKDKRYGYTTFVRNGCVFLRNKKGDITTSIYTEDDLNNFLDRLSPTLISVLPTTQTDATTINDSTTTIDNNFL